MGAAPTTAQSLALSARFVLACANGGTAKEIAARLGVRDATASRWRGRCIRRRLEELHDESRPSRPPSALPAKEVVTALPEESPTIVTAWYARKAFIGQPQEVAAIKQQVKEEQKSPSGRLSSSSCATGRPGRRADHCRGHNCRCATGTTTATETNRMTAEVAARQLANAGDAILLQQHVRRRAG